MTIKDKNDAINVANDILRNKERYVILDTETTGLGENDVVIQIALLDLDGNVLLDTLIRPTKRKRIPKEAQEIHGITMNILRNAPTFRDIYPRFEEIVKNKNVIIYNAKYDLRLLYQTALQDDVDATADFRYLCAMLHYSVYVGKWSDYHGSFKFQPLPGGDHTAIGDCKAVLELIKKMASAKNHK